MLRVTPLIVLAACASSPEPKPPANAPSYGVVYAQVGNSLTVGAGNPGHLFEADTRPPAVASAACAGATATVGACCYVPPSTTTPPPGTQADIGPLTLVDLTSGVTMATLTFGPKPAGFGTMDEYGGALLDPVTWKDGDTLEIEGERFARTRPAVAMPDVPELSSVSRTTSLVMTWTPDPHADTTTVELVANGTITCSVPDSAGTVTVDASLLASFTAGHMCWVTTTRETDTYVDLGDGWLTVASQGLAESIVPVN